MAVNCAWNVSVFIFLKEYGKRPCFNSFHHSSNLLHSYPSSYRLAPDDQKEDWHKTLTDRNEGRLPDKLRTDLKAAKRRAEAGLKKQSSELMSYFLVEFMGTHEFNWVKESDIIESFDPEEDVNIAAAAGNITKKRRSTAFNTKQMTNALALFTLLVLECEASDCITFNHWLLTQKAVSELHSAPSF